MEFDAIATLTACPERGGCEGLALSMLQANEEVLQGVGDDHKR